MEFIKKVYIIFSLFFLFIFCISWTINEKLQQKIVNVKDFGAKGDGKTDDWLSIENALNSMDKEGGVLYFPEGIYRVKYAITLKSNVTYRGASKEKTIIKASDDSLDNVFGMGYPLYQKWMKARKVGGSISRLMKPDFLSQYSESEAMKSGGMAGTAVLNVKIENLCIDGNKDLRKENQLNLKGIFKNTTFLAGEIIKSSNKSTAQISGVFGSKDGFSIEPRSIRGIFNKGDIVVGSESGAIMKIEEVKADDAYQMLVRFDAVSYSSIQNCIFKNSIFTALSIYNYSNFNIIRDNVFYDNNKKNTSFTWGRMNIFIEFDAFSNTIKNNIIYGGLGYGILVQSAGGANYNTKLLGNQIYNPSSDGIRLGNEATRSPIINAEIINNKIIGANSEGAVAIRVIHYGEGTVSGTLIENNVIENCTYGILLQGGVEKSIVRNNSISNCKNPSVASTGRFKNNILENLLCI